MTAIAIRHTMRFVVHAVDFCEHQTRHVIGLLGSAGQAAGFDRQPVQQAPHG